MKSSSLLALLISLLLPGVISAADMQQKLYVLSSAGNDVTIIDVATNTIIGSIEVGDRPHGIAAPRSHDVLYITTEFDNGLTIVDPVKDVVVRKYNIFGQRPNEIDVTSDGRFVYLPILGHGVYEVFDTVTEKIVARLATNGLPHNVVISPDDKFAYLSPMDGGRTPAEALSKAGYPTTSNEKIYVVDVSSHQIVDTIATGDAPRPITISPDGNRLYVNVDGLQGFLVLDLQQRKQVARVEYELTAKEQASPSRSHGIIATLDGKELWTSDVNHGLVFVFDVTRNPPKQLARLDNGAAVYWMTITPDGKTIYVSSAEADVVTAYDVKSRTKKATIQLPEGKSPKRMLVLQPPAIDGSGQ